VSLELVQGFVLVLFTSTAIATDWARQHIYNVTTYSTMLIGLLLGALQGIPGEIFVGGFADHLFAGISPFVLFVLMPIPPVPQIDLSPQARSNLRTFLTSTLEANTKLSVCGRRWMKGGDVKLLMAIGALMGTNFLVSAFLYGTIIGGLAGVGFVVFHMIRGNGMLRGMKSYMPYGVSLGAGALLALVAGVSR
jgi:prepilin signal peptidase PulO-like enzyme (type II secretory pathway)